MALRVAQARGEFAGKDDAEVRDLTARAFQIRPELAGLAEQARALGFQADATRANLRPQVSVNGGFLFLGAENFIPQGNGFASLPRRLGPSPTRARPAASPSRSRPRGGRPPGAGPTWRRTSPSRSGPAGSTSSRPASGSRSPGSR